MTAYPTPALRRAGCRAAALAAAAALTAACNNFDFKDPNQPTLNSITGSPTAAVLAPLAVGLFQYSRQDIQDVIWRVGSMGREGINLAGNNQPDYGEPYYGPLNPSQFGGAIWAREYTEIRNANIYIDAVPRASDLSAADKASSIGMAQTLKALAFLYVVETRAQLGAPVDVDRPVTAAPAPFVGEDSVYATIIHTLDSAATNLAAGGGSFPFTVPPGYTGNGFGSPATFLQFTEALKAKAEVLRATDNTACAGSVATCYNAALTALGLSFISSDPTTFAVGPYYDFGVQSGDSPNNLSDPLNGPTFFSLTENLLDAQRKSDNTLDARALSKIDSIPVGQAPQILGGIPIQGIYKFAVYLSPGGVSNPSAPIPIIRNEELLLLRAEAELGLGELGAAVNDINIVRENAGGLPAFSSGSAAAILTELLYERRYSLLWEQGTRWIDARRYNLLATIPAEPIAPTPWTQQGNVPTVMPIPQDECLARHLASPCDPLGT